jgi:hypothetical protein
LPGATLIALATTDWWPLRKSRTVASLMLDGSMPALLSISTEMVASSGTPMALSGGREMTILGGGTIDFAGHIACLIADT